MAMIWVNKLKMAANVRRRRTFNLVLSDKIVCVRKTMRLGNFQWFGKTFSSLGEESEASLNDEKSEWLSNGGVTRCKCVNCK